MVKMSLTGRLLWTLAVCLALAGAAAAQELLPAQFAGWKAAAEERVGPGALQRFVGQQAAALREYGVLSADRRTYTRQDASLVATVFRMTDATAAFGAFTFLRTDEMAEAGLGEHSAISRQWALVPLGNLLLVVEQPEGDLRRVEPDLKTLVGLLYPKAQPGLLPTLDQFLPSKGMVPGSRRYVVGPVTLNRAVPLGHADWIGFSEGAEVAVARYRLDGQVLTLLLASYPTPQLAARRMEELGKWLPLNLAGPVAERQQAVYAKRSASLLGLVLGADSKETADALLAPVRYESDLTWNEPGYSATDPGVGEIIVTSIYGTGALLIFALMVGIGFGGLRLIGKRLLPGRLFDRPRAVEIIQLGLGAKPIESKDFYS